MNYFCERQQYGNCICYSRCFVDCCSALWRERSTFIDQSDEGQLKDEARHGNNLKIHLLFQICFAFVIQRC